MTPPSLLITSLLLSAATALQSVGAQPRRGSDPAHEETNWNTAKNNSKKNLQDLINNLKEKCNINLSGTFNNIASLIRVLKKLEAEDLVACNISRKAANLTENYFLISAEDLTTETAKERPTETKRGPELEICEESTTIPDLSVTKQQSHPIPDIGFVSPGMEILARKTATSTIAPIPDLGFISPDMAKRETEYHSGNSTPPEYEEDLSSEPDEKKIQTVLQNFQQATQEDQQQQSSQRKGRKISKRHEPSDDFVEDNWSQVEKDAHENKEFKPVAHDPNQSVSSEDAFDELVQELDTPRNNDLSKKDPNEGSNPHRYTDEELVQNTIDKLKSDQLHGKETAGNLSADELVSASEDENGENTGSHEEMTNDNNPKNTHGMAKHSLRDTVEDLVAASLIVIFIILALIAMFYTVSFVKAKEKEKCPTITIIESGSRDRTRKYTVSSSSKHGSPVCYGKIVRSPRQRQLRHKRERMPVEEVGSSKSSTDSSNRTAETMSLPPTQMVSICPRPLRSHVSRAYSPQPLSPQSVSPHSLSSQLPSRQQTRGPSPQWQGKHKEAKKPIQRETVQPSYETSRPKTTRRLELQDAESPSLQKDKPSAEHRASLPPVPRRLELQTGEPTTLPRDRPSAEHRASQLTSPRRLASQDKGIPLSFRDSTLADHQTSQITTLERLPLQDEGSAVSTRNMEVTPYPESPLTSVPRRVPEIGLPVSASDTALSDNEDPHQATTKRISFYNVSDTGMSDHQPSYQPSVSRMPSMDHTASAISARDATLSGYYPSYHPSFSRMPSGDDSVLAVSAGNVRHYPSSSIMSSVDNATIAAKPREVTLPNYLTPMHSWNAPLSVSDKSVVRNINRDIEQKQLSLSAPNLPVHSVKKQKVPMRFPYQPGENGEAHYPLSMTTTNTKSVSLIPPQEPSDTVEGGSMERSSRSAFISDEGDIVSTEPYAEPSSTTIRPIRSSQHAVPITHSLPFVPQLSHIKSSRKSVPLSLSYGSLAPRHSSFHPLTQRARSKSVSIPVAPLSPFWPNQRTYQGSISARDLSPRIHHIPKGSEVGITSPNIVQSSTYPISPLPQGQNQQPITQSQMQYQLPSLSPSPLSSPYLPEESIRAYTPSRQQITQDYIPDEVAPANINQAPECYIIRPGQQPLLPSPTAAHHSFVEPSFSYSGVAPSTTQGLPHTDTSYSGMPYSASYNSSTQPLQGWISPASPAAREVGISNIPSQRGFANLPQDNLQSGHDLFPPTTAHSPSAYSVSQHSSMLPSYQQVSPILQPGSESDVYSRSQATMRSPLPRVPPPLSPSAHTGPVSLQQSLPSFQPLSPLSLTFLRKPAAESSQVAPSESQSSKLQEPFHISRFEDSEFLKGKPISQSFIFKDYSSPTLSRIASAPQLFNLTPRRYSYSNDEVFTYPDGSQHLVSTPKHSRTMSVSIDPEVFHTALESTTSISSGSTEAPSNKLHSQRRVQDSFPTSSESVYQVPPSPSQREKYTGMSSDYSVNEISSDTNQFPKSPYYSAGTFFNDSSDYTNSD